MKVTQGQDVSEMSQRVIPPYATAAVRQAGATMPYLTVAEAADLVRVSPKRLRNLMSDGTLKEGVHYTRPRGLAPRFKREALLEWIEGCDTDHSLEDAKRQRRRAGSKVDLTLIPRVHGHDDGL